MLGAAGIDLLKGGLGNDTLDGGASSDYAIYDGNRAAYTLTKTSATTVTGAEGSDSLIDVEYFRFADGDLSIWSLSGQAHAGARPAPTPVSHAKHLPP